MESIGQIVYDLTNKSNLKFYNILNVVLSDFGIKESDKDALKKRCSISYFANSSVNGGTLFIDDKDVLSWSTVFKYELKGNGIKASAETKYSKNY